MRIMSSTTGIVLIFDSLKELGGTIKHLTGLKEWAEAEGVDPPHLYSQFDERIPTEEIDDMLDMIKAGPIGFITIVKKNS